MESVLNYCIELMQWIPKEVILTIVIVVLLTEATKSGLKSLEDYLEEKKENRSSFSIILKSSLFRYGVLSDLLY